MLKGTRNIYIFLTVFIIFAVSATTLSFLDVLPAVILMWLCFFAFAVGHKSCRSIKKNFRYHENTNNLFNFFHKKKTMTIIICFACAILYVYFYTGNSPLTVLKSITGGYSLYFDYQNYFKESGLGEFSFSKLPFILMNVIQNILVITGIFYALKKAKKTSIKDLVYSGMLGLSLLYIGIARGTNFELFELLCILYYSALSKFSDRKVGFKTALIIILAGLLGVIVFSVIMSRRGFSGFYITDDIKYDQNSLISKMFPSFSMMISQLTCYFGFGFRFTSYFLSNYLMMDNNLVAALIPGGFQFIGHDPISDIVAQISCGTNWRPDIVYFVGRVGLFGVFLSLFIVGRISAIFEKERGYIAQTMNYLIMLQMFSLPIANFIRISSTNLVVLFLCIVLLLIRKLLRTNREGKVFFERSGYAKNQCNNSSL